MEQANPRHEHEWRVWEDIALPEGKKLIPGVVTHHTNVVEHPELVAQRLVRLANVVGRDNVLAGTDCGFAQGAFIHRVHAEIQWAKLASLAQGARLATQELWGAEAPGRVARGRAPPDHGEAAAGRLVDVVLARGRHGILVAGLGTADDLANLGHGAGTAVGLRERGGPQQPDAGPQAVKRLTDRPVPGALEQDVVEVILRRQHLLDAGVPPLGEPLDLPEGSAQPFDLTVGGVAYEPAAGERLERGSHLVEVSRLLGGGHDHDRALLGNRGHQPLGGELAQHLANGGPRDAGLLDQLAFDQALAGLEAEIEDRLTQHIEHLLAQRRGHPADSHRQVPGITT